MTKKSKIIITILGTVCCLILGCLCFLKTQLNKVNYIDSSFDLIPEEDLEEENIGNILNDYSTLTDNKNIITIQKDNPIYDGIVNILLVGVDRQGTKGYGRSDCMMILTMNTNTKEIKLASLLRDNYVSIPGYSFNKMNASYAYGGPDLLMETIKENFGISLDKYIYVDFNEFSNIIDALGGVDIKLTEKEYKNMYNTAGESKIYHLNGEDALKYVRIRKIDSDFGRTTRQRNVLSALYESFKNKSTTELVEIATSLLPYINTNLTQSELLELLYTGIAIKPNNIQQMMVPVEGTYKFDTTSSGASIIALDLEENARLLQEYIFGESEIKESVNITEETNNIYNTTPITSFQVEMPRRTAFCSLSR